jgi:hypothetical protein
VKKADLLGSEGRALVAKGARLIVDVDDFITQWQDKSWQYMTIFCRQYDPIFS